MDTIVPNSDNFSQDSFPNSAGLDKFGKDYAEYVNQRCYEDVVVRSGVAEDIYDLNFPSAIGTAVYEPIFADSDKTNNSGISVEAARNLARCEGSKGYFLGPNFYIPSDLAGGTKAARSGIIKSEGIFRPAGPAAGGWIANGRFRQLTGAPIALDEKGSLRRYHQPKGKPLEIFFPAVTVRVGKLVAEKAGLPMPEFPVIGLGGEWLGFWDWAESSGCPIVITEGEKKAALLVSRGYATIGLPGITTGYRVTERGETITKPNGTQYQKAIAHELHEALKPFDTKGRIVFFTFDYRDGNCFETPEFKAASTTSRLFANVTCKIALLPGPHKAIDDFAVAGGDVDALLSGAKDYQKLRIEAQWRRNRQYTPDRAINSRYFHASAPASGTITGILSGLATGKTQWLKDIIASNPEGRIIVLGSRNGLLLQTAEKCGFYHLNAHNGYQMFKDPNARLCLCFDSLMKLPPEIFEGATIILDEAESVLRHLLMSSTLRRDREATKERFSQGCQDADRIILLDGHLTDYTVSMVAKIAGNKRVIKHLNEYKGNCPKARVFETESGKPTAAEKQAFINLIENSGCPAIATDFSVPEAEALAITLTERFGKGLLICSKNSTDPDLVEFQTDPDAWIEKNNPAWIIYTPTLENGIDISILEWCTDVFGLFCGVLGVNSLIQMLRRVRHPLNQISILCPGFGLQNSDRTSYYANQINLQIQLNIDIEKGLLGAEEYMEDIKAQLERQYSDPLFKAYCHFEAQENLEKSELREFLVQALIADGYEVDRPSIGIDESGRHIENKILCKEKEAQEIFEAPDISLEEAQEISRSNKASWPERCQAEKCRLKTQLPGIENTELWNWQFVHRVRFDDRSLLTQLETAWLFNNPEDAEYLQRSKWETGKLESSLSDHSSRWLKLKTLSELKLRQFLDPDRTWSEESPEIQEFLKWGKNKDVAKILGNPGKSGIKYVNRLLRLIGVSLISRQTRGEGKDRLYTYHYQPEATTKLTKKGPIRVCSLPENWHELSALTAARMSQKVEAKKAAAKTAETSAPYALDAVIDGTDFINTQIEPSMTKTTPENTTAGEASAETGPPTSKGRMGWVWRWGREWVRARFLATTDGAQLRMLIEQVGGWTETLAWPHQIRWEDASC
ncbi:DUF3854 domain-containing protein [Microcoleus sp. S28C3]|uniref:plasmid replication protein, CyRepA1 family n=1 Tax=Microcoleus sp. S28C3 TaxID=3055414 RepID=UPI002FD74BE8